jgi:hypothetical protein
MPLAQNLPVYLFREKLVSQVAIPKPSDWFEQLTDQSFQTKTKRN